MTKRNPSLSERIYRSLLRIFPFDFRWRYGQEMEEVFQNQRREVQKEERRLGLLNLWVTTVQGIVRVAPKEHLQRLRQDAGYALRVMRRSPGFTAVVILTLALGIGANTAIFSVVNAVLLRPLPFPDPDRLVTVWAVYGAPYSMSAPELFDFRERQESFERFGIYYDARVNATLTGEGEPVNVSAHAVTAELFTVLGIEPMLGRTFTAEEDLTGSNRVVVLEHGFWLRRFGGDPSIVGETLNLNGVDLVVLGVMPSGFALPFHNYPTDLWVPLALNPANPGSRTSYNKFMSVARLKPGVSLEQADADVRRITAELMAEYPEAYPERFARFQPNGVASIHKNTTGQVRPALLILLGAVGFVLLIACANVANLLLWRAATREKEMAIRAALGAGRGRIVRQLLTESLLLFLAGGGAGILLAYWSLTTLIQFAPQNIPRLQETGLDFQVLGFAFGVSVLTGVLFGLVPALQSAKVELHESLKEGGRTTGAPGRSRLRNLLVVAEVALSLILLVGASLLMRSFYNLLQVDLGIRTENVLTFRIGPPSARYPESHQVISFYEKLLRRARALPGVEAAGAITWGPLTGFGRANTSLMVEGMPGNRPEYPALPHGTFRALWRNVTPGYFRTLGITLLRGRLLEESDAAQAPAVAIVDEHFAREAWPGEEAVLGRRVAWPLNVEGAEQQWRTVIGVVRNAQNIRLPSTEVPQVYFPQSQAGGRVMNVVVKTASAPRTLLPLLRHEVASLDPNLPLYDIATMDERLSGVVSEPRFNALLMGLFAFVALALGTVGLYGVIVYAVSHRTHEFGIRMALGAQRRDILKMVVGRGMGLALVGVGVGLAASLALTRFLSSLLFAVSATDPATLLGISLLLLIVALLVCYLPARRATRVNPMVALRYE